MKSIIYTRISTEKTKDANSSLLAQEQRIRDYCTEKGLDVLEVITSQTSDNKIGMGRLLKVIQGEKEKIAVCCDSVDRLSRSTFDRGTSMLYEMALADKIEIHFVLDGQIMNDQMSAVERFQFGISFSLGQYYQKALSERAKMGWEKRKSCPLNM